MWSKRVRCVRRRKSNRTIQKFKRWKWKIARRIGFYNNSAIHSARANWQFLFLFDWGITERTDTYKSDTL